MQKGTIARITDKGFGFITVDGTQPSSDGRSRDLFFHQRGLADGLMIDTLKQGERVVFDVEQSPKGPNAVNVRKESSQEEA